MTIGAKPIELWAYIGGCNSLLDMKLEVTDLELVSKGLGHLGFNRVTF